MIRNLASKEVRWLPVSRTIPTTSFAVGWLMKIYARAVNLLIQNQGRTLYSLTELKNQFSHFPITQVISPRWCVTFPKQYSLLDKSKVHQALRSVLRMTLSFPWPYWVIPEFKMGDLGLLMLFISFAKLFRGFSSQMSIWIAEQVAYKRLLLQVLRLVIDWIPVNMKKSFRPDRTVYRIIVFSQIPMYYNQCDRMYLSAGPGQNCDLLPDITLSKDAISNGGYTEYPQNQSFRNKSRPDKRIRWRATASYRHNFKHGIRSLLEVRGISKVRFVEQIHLQLIRVPAGLFRWLRSETSGGLAYLSGKTGHDMPRPPKQDQWHLSSFGLRWFLGYVYAVWKSSISSELVRCPDRN